MAFTRDWDESTPAGTDNANTIDDTIKANEVDLSDRLKTLIYGFIAGENDGNPGFKNAIFKQQSSAPSTPNADEISVYALDDGSNCGLFAKQEDGYTKQILKKVGTDILLDVSDEVDDSTIEVSSGKLQLKDDGITGAKMSATFQFTDLIKGKASTDPTHDDHLARKKYVDDTYLAGQAVQIVNTQTGAVNTGTTIMPLDDTIPQNDEGDEYMTQAITPTSATNKLKIDIVWCGARNSSVSLSLGLFQDSTANALAAVADSISTANTLTIMKLTYYMAAGTTSETTFKVRVGPHNSGTVTFNGVSAGRIFGGVACSSITITEIKV